MGTSYRFECGFAAGRYRDGARIRPYGTAENSFKCLFPSTSVLGFPIPPPWAAEISRHHQHPSSHRHAIVGTKNFSQTRKRAKTNSPGPATTTTQTSNTNAQSGPLCPLHAKVYLSHTSRSTQRLSIPYVAVKPMYLQLVALCMHHARLVTISTDRAI
jgi:hypothetical protein